MLKRAEDKEMNIPMIDLIETGKNITRLRKEKGLSVKDLQKKSLDDIIVVITPEES